jgi:glutamyl-tRNA synthetase
MIDGTTFRLMDLYNAKLEAKGPQPRCSFAGDSRVQEMRKIQWVAEPHTKVRVLIPDVLYDDAGKFNPDGLKSVDGVAEESAASVGIGEVVQFPRFGFCRRDSESTFIFAHR